MALPISSSPLPPDVAVHGWAAITVRVAWTLLALRVRPRPEVLRDARDHVLFHLDPTTPLTHAEDLAAHYTRGFVARARQRPLVDPWPQDAAMPLGKRWRRALDQAMRPVGRQVFQHHYGYGRPLAQLARQLQVDTLTLEEARGGLREMVRRIAVQDELPLDGWSEERLDRLLVRLAALSVHDSPPLDEVAEGCHREWIRVCPRVDRTSRLVRAGVLTSEDLVPPAWAARPNGRVKVLAIQLHPDARAERQVLADEIGGHIQLLDDDLLLVDGGEDARSYEVLQLAAEIGRPRAEHLRAVLLEGPGRWSRLGLLGPLCDEARAGLRAQPWGVVEGHGELPETLPPTPSSRPWWGAVGALALVTVLVGILALQPSPGPVDHALDVSFTPGRGGVWAAFDTDEEAHVTLVRQVDGRLEVVLDGADPAAKAAFATGDGSFRMHAVADGVLVASTHGPVADLGDLLHDARDASLPLSELARRIRQQDPGAAVAFGER